MAKTVSPAPRDAHPTPMRLRVRRIGTLVGVMLAVLLAAAVVGIITHDLWARPLAPF